MTTYLTKNVDGQVHHYRATVEQTGLEMVQGIFYQWLDTHFHNYNSAAEAAAAQARAVQKKIDEGFTVTEFISLPENTIDIYDKAKWHYEGDFPKELDQYQGYVHTGMFFGWLIDHDMVSDDFKKDFAAEISAFKQRQYTGTQLYKSCCDGTLMLEDLSEEGNRFAMQYFIFEKGDYLGDYESTLGADTPSIYHVQDTWENYELLKAVIDNRYAEFKK